EAVFDGMDDGLRRRHSAFQLASCEKGIAILIEMLRDRDVFIRRSAVFAFDELTEQSEIPKIAKNAIPALKELLKDPDEIVRGMAGEVLKQMGVLK
ncbi:MAG TPA: HEAT repeat domain-containing protein, partial [Blastocatellia bacterium]